MRNSSRKRTVGWIAGGAAFAVTVLGVTGCSSDKDSDEKKPAASDSSAAKDSTGGDEKEKNGSGAAKSSDTPHSTAQEAVETWVGALIEKKPKKACLVMGQPASGSKPEMVGSPATCNSESADAQEKLKNIEKIGASFTPKSGAGKPKVEAAEVPVSGGKAVFPADKVTINGVPLEKTIAANSAGVKEGQLDVKIETAELKGAWYVTNFRMGLG